MATVKKCSNCNATVDSEGKVTAGIGNSLPTMQVDENGMGPDVKKCYRQGICPCCLQATLSSADPTITVEFTREEGALLLKMLQEKNMTQHPLGQAQELLLAGKLFTKINTAAKEAGYPLPGEPI